MAPMTYLTPRGLSEEDARDMEVVDIRHTLRRAAREGMQGPEARQALARLAEIARRTGETALRYEVQRWKMQFQHQAAHRAA